MCHSSSSHRHQILCCVSLLMLIHSSVYLDKDFSRLATLESAIRMSAGCSCISNDPLSPIFMKMSQIFRQSRFSTAKNSLRFTVKQLPAASRCAVEIKTTFLQPLFIEWKLSIWPINISTIFHQRSIDWVGFERCRVWLLGCSCYRICWLRVVGEDSLASALNTLANA